MKYLLLLAILVVAYLLWRNARLAARDERDERGPPPAPTPSPGNPQDMVSCPVCAVHLPRSEAVPGAYGRLYCSQEHRILGGG